MVKHIVMWRLKNKADATMIQAKLEALRGKIPGLISLEVGIDFSDTEQSADIVLVSVLENEAALQVYQNHADHQAVIPMMKEATISRTLVDYHVGS